MYQPHLSISSILSHKNRLPKMSLHAIHATLLPSKISFYLYRYIGFEKVDDERWSSAIGFGKRRLIGHATPLNAGKM